MLVAVSVAIVAGCPRIAGPFVAAKAMWSQLLSMFL